MPRPGGDDERKHIIAPARAKTNNFIKKPDNKPATFSSRLHEQELDPHKIAQRQKQIDFGKNTIGYSNYIRLVPLQQRTKSDPQTPDVRAKYSKRQWDGIMKKWRRQLHQWDPVTDQRPGAQLEDSELESQGADDTNPVIQDLDNLDEIERQLRDIDDM